MPKKTTSIDIREDKDLETFLEIKEVTGKDKNIDALSYAHVSGKAHELQSWDESEQ